MDLKLACVCTALEDVTYQLFVHVKSWVYLFAEKNIKFDFPLEHQKREKLDRFKIKN
jgi:hypothetical protein